MPCRGPGSEQPADGPDCDLCRPPGNDARETAPHSTVRALDGEPRGLGHITCPVTSSVHQGGCLLPALRFCERLRGSASGPRRAPGAVAPSPSKAVRKPRRTGASLTRTLNYVSRNPVIASATLQKRAE